MYLVIDCETGGLIPEQYSLLTLYMGVYNDDFTFVEELDLKLKPVDNIYRVCSEALKINKIDLIEHDAKSCTMVVAKNKALELLSKYSKNKRLTVVGHNVNFDMNFIFHHFITKLTWNYHTDYNVIDTYMLAGFFLKNKLLPDSIKLSLESLCNYFGIINHYTHVAKFDAMATFEVYKRLIQLTTQNKECNSMV